MKKYLWIPIAVMVNTSAGMASDKATADRGEAWQASWIGAAEKTESPETSSQKGSTKNQWTCYRKVVNLKSAPRRAVARIAVDSKYWLWINGKLVVFEGQLKRGPTPNDTYYDQVDLTKHLQNNPLITP
jgi:alpha-L-rhamnosidase